MTDDQADESEYDDDQIVSMPTNPGGVVDPDELVGRRREEHALLGAVDAGGAKLLGDRRMGKTSLLRKAEQSLRAVGHHVIRVSAETKDPAVFGRRVLTAMREEGVLRRGLPSWARELEGSVSLDVGLASFSLTGTGARSSDVSVDLFAACSEAARRSGDSRVVFIIDEVTALARAMAIGGSAEELFRTLRAPRQMFGNISVVIAGSIGLHHVLSDMAVVNDITSVRVGPLSTPAAVHLARCLLRGASIATDNEIDVAGAIASETSAIPFYIQKLVESLEQRGMVTTSPQEIHWLVDAILADPDDPWEMRHYEKRLESYYGADAGLVRALVDLYALSGHPLGLADIAAGLLAVDLDRPRPSRDELLDLVYRLEADHYLTRLGDGDIVATSLLRRAWIAMRRLS